MAGLIGQKIDRYEILEMIGVGGMATVYKAYDTRLEREVAIKFIKREAFPPDQLEMILKRFEREAKSLGRLSHPNIVGVIDYGEYDGAPYLVMTYLPGGTLKQKLGKPIPWREAVQMILPIARALKYVHDHNIINRDVKPSNILLTENDQAMLTDFGLVKLFEGQDTQQLTDSGAGIGTPDYMAPEQWTGEATALSDMYSLGVVLYEMVTGHRPYVSDTPAGILLKQVNEPLPPPNQYIPDLPKNIESVLLKVLARKPEDRYPNMNAFANELQNILEGGQASATAVGKEKLLEQMTGTVKKQEIDQAREKIAQSQKEKVQSTPHTPPTVKRNPMMPIVIIVVGACALLALCGGSWLVYSFSQSAAKTPTALAFSSPTIPPIPQPTESLPSTIEPSPLPDVPTPQPQTGEFELLLQEFADRGYINTTEGETIPIESFKEEVAELTYYYWPLDQDAADLVFAGHFKWSTSNATSEKSGCGVIFGLQENDDHYAVFLDKSQISFFMSRGSFYYEVGKTRGPGRVNFSNPAEANFVLAVKGQRAYVSVDGEVTDYTLSQDQTTSGGFGLAVLSGIASGYGTRCEMTDMFLFKPK